MPHWIGQIIRKKLQFKNEKRHGSYAIAASEGPKLTRLFERYGIESIPGDSGDSGDSQTEAQAQEPLFFGR